MRRKCILICCFFMLFLSALKANEDWLCVYPDRTAYFEDSGKLVYTVRIDSVRNNGNTLYPFSDFRQVDYDCYSATSGSWLAKRIVSDENKNTAFITGNDETFFIKNKAGLNDTWEAFSNEHIKVTGKIASVEPQSILGATDSIKTISFTVTNPEGEPVDHALNQQTVQIGKTLGLVKTFNFYRLEHSDYQDTDIPLSEFHLIGVKEPQLGFKPLNRREDYYDFQVGDEFHIYYMDSPMGTPRYVESKTINTYLSRTDYADSIVYTYENKVQRIEQKEDKTVSTTLTSNIARQKIEKGLLFTTEPNEPYDDEHIIKKVMIVNNKLPEMYIWNSEADWNEETSCYQTNVMSDNCVIPAYYAPGLGYVYDGCCEIFGNNTCHELVYYKKGDVEVGTPIDLPSKAEYVTDRAYRIASKDGVLTVSFDTAQEAVVTLYNISGMAVRHLTVNNSTVTMPTVSLPAGIYLLNIRTENGRDISTEKIVIQ